MNLNEIKKCKFEIEKRYWVFVTGFKKNPSRFKAVKSKMGPATFVLIIVQREQELIITNNSVSVYCDRIEDLSIGKEYTKEDYFTNSLLYNLPSPEELSEIRKYFKKNHKNHQVTVYL